MSITIEFTPWGHFYARKKREEIRRWLHSIGEASVDAFKSGMGEYPPASAPGAWPNRRSGRLRASVRAEVKSDEVTVGTSMPYSLYLRHGTSKMKRRKMSDDALKAGMKSGRLAHWVVWTHG